MILDEEHITGMLVIIGIVSVIFMIGFVVHLNTSQKSDFKECMTECRETYAHVGTSYYGIENEEFLKECTDKCFDFKQEITADDYTY